MLKRTTVVLTLLVNMPLSLFAARPFITDDAGTVAQSGFELEFASDYWKDFGLHVATIKHGITDRMDLGVAFGYMTAPVEKKAAQPMELSIKYNFLPEHFSFSATGVFSSATYAINAIYSHDLKMISGHANLGIEVTGESSDVTLTYGLAAVFNVGIAAIGAELGGADKELSWWQVGAQLNILDWLAIDSGLGGGFSKDVNLYVTSGLCFFWGGGR
jgi:hypothetical protein